MAWRLRSTPSCSMGSSLSRRPAVSTRRKGRPASSTFTSMVSRVVPGRWVTMARSYPARALRREDLPALGRPMRAQVIPWASICPRRPVASRAWRAEAWA